MEIKVLTYNTALLIPEYDTYLRANQIRDIIQKGKWDFVGFCEVFHSTLRKIIVNSPEVKQQYPWIISGKKQVGEIDNGLILFSKYPLKSVERYQYKTFYDVWYNKILPPKDIIFAIADVNGTEVGIFLTHLQWGDSKEFVDVRKGHIAELRKYIETKWDFKKPTIILGDLNISGEEENGDLAFLKEVFSDSYDWWEHLHDINKEPGYTWDPKNVKIIAPLVSARLDFILSNNKIKPMESDVIRFSGNGTKIQYFPESDFTTGEMIWYFLMMTVFRIFLIPTYIVFLSGFNFLRLVNRAPSAVYYSQIDLSDHFALEGRGELLIE